MTKMIGVTTLINKYKAPFDKEAIAQKSLDKYNRERLSTDPEKTIQDILADWDASRKAGIELHKQIKDYLMEDKIPNPMTPQFVNFMDWHYNTCIDIYHKGNVQVIGCERWVKSEKYKICGSVDCIIRIGQMTYIIDWKTAKNFSVDNGFGQTMINGLDHLPACSLVEGSLQLHIYRHLLNEDPAADLGYLEPRLVNITATDWESYEGTSYPEEMNLLLRNRLEELKNVQ